MIRMGKGTKKSSIEVIAEAVAFFGPGGWGLEVEERADCCTRLVGGGGHVFVQVTDDGEPGGREILVEGTEWEAQIQQFVAKI